MGSYEDDATDASLSGLWRVDLAFSRVACSSPDRIACELGDRRISYGELEQTSNRLAHQLLDRAIGRGSVVAVAAGNLASFAAGALAVMKTGAAYLPIDLRHPLSRARAVLAQGCADLLLLGDEQLGEIAPSDLPTYAQLHRAFASSDKRDERPRVAFGANDPAYLCFTSGSTGKAKGVVIGHQGIEGLVSDPAFRPYLASDRVAQVTTLAFDAATLEIWGTLCVGACLIDAPQDVLFSGPRLEAFFETRAISAIWLTTSHFNALASRNPSAFARLRTVMIGGEAVDPAVIARVFQEGQAPVRLLNCYGPTETTTLTTWHPISAEDAASGVIPIGRPLQGRTVAIRNKDLRPVACGDPGELLIGGAAVAHGYWHAPELTRASFIDDPEAPGTRLYRSGDQCKELPDGSIVSLGRQDEQVKIRGFRVELQGVSSKLLAIPGVLEAAVLARPTQFGSKELLAFVCTSNGLPASQVRRRLKQSVEDFLVPARILRIDALPRTANGKLDQDALLRLCESENQPDRMRRASESPIESVLISIWQDLFRREDISTDDDFFALGGDSLQLMELVARVESDLHAVLQPEHVKSPLELNALASTIEQLQANLPQMRAVSAFLISSPWTMRGLPQAYGDALSRGGESQQLQVPPSLFDCDDPDLMQSMVTALRSQLLAVNPVGPYRIAGYSFSGLLAFELACRLELEGHAVEILILIDSVFGRRSLGGFSRTLGDRLRRRLRRSLRGPRPEQQAEETDSGSFILNRCIREARRYRPRAFAGRVLLARSNETVVGGFASWRKHLRGKVIEQQLGGDHLSLIFDPVQVDQVAEAIQRAMPESRNERAPRQRDCG